MHRENTDTSDVGTPKAAPANDQTLDVNIEALSLEHQYTGHGKLGHGQDETGHDSTVDKQIDNCAAGQESRDCRSPASNVKDVEQALQYATTCRCEESKNALIIQRDRLEGDLARVHQRLGAMRKDNEALTRQIRDVRLQLAEGNPQLKAQIASLQGEKRALEADINEAHQNGLMDGLRSQCAQSERVILVQQVEAYKKEAAKWKQEALGKGSKAISMCWQASVDEAVRKKRESDMLAIQLLKEENAALRAEKRK